MMIAMPSVTGYITSSRKNSMISDAKMYVKAATNYASINNLLPTIPGETSTISTSLLEIESGGKTSPFGSEWDMSKCYVNVTNENGNYIYSISLSDKKQNCIPETDVDNLSDSLVTTNCATTSRLPDLSGNGNTGTVFGNIDISDGKAYFDGNDDYINAGLLGHDFKNSFSIIARFSYIKNSVPSECAYVFGNWEKAGFGIYINPDKMFGAQLYIDGASNYSYINVDCPDLDKEHTYIQTYDGSTQKVYIDGILKAQKSISGNVKVSTEPFLIGANPANSKPTTYFGFSNVNVTHAILFDRTLTASEISANYSGIPNVTDKTNLLLYYEF